ncbi:MAG TPA: hypothetical protein VFR22_02760, partial [Nocardioidaceae bacterium]|nr:hypothetical protein [Nocardioidaceae bacterium]
RDRVDEGIEADDLADARKTVEDPMIAQLMGSGTVDAAVVALVRAALDAGSNDNVTCILAEVVDEEFTAHHPLIVGAAAEQMSRGSDTSRQAPVIDDGDDEFRDPEEMRYAPLAPRRFRWVRRLIILVVILAAVGIGTKWLYDWTQRQYYVGEHEGQVVIFKGLDGSIAGFDLSDVYENPVPPLDVSTLNQVWRDRVDEGIEADDLADARKTVEDLRTTVTESNQPGQTPTGPTQSGPSSPGQSPSGQQSPSKQKNQGGRS